MAKKPRLPFDSAGGTVVIQRRLLSSPSYLNLSAQAKALLHLLQAHWRPHEPVGFGIRQAQREIPCSRQKAMDCFRELQDAGFIVKRDESLFNSREGSKTRTWRLTWLPERYCYGYGRAPTNDWEKARG